MPLNDPKSLSDDEVYAVVAYILQLNGVIGENDTIDAKTLSAVKMPNRDGVCPFFPRAMILISKVCLANQASPPRPGAQSARQWKQA
jgi:hypothetical protein